MSATKLASIVGLVIKYGTSDLIKDRGELGNDDVVDPPPEELVSDLEEMGPTFVKFGQLLSTRADLLPAPYLKALQKLQDGVDPIDFDEVREVVESELGVGIHKAFLTLDEEPLATGSLAQVHRAQLRDGTPVAVKVQRPGIRERVEEDLEALEKAAAMAEPFASVSALHPTDLVEQFRNTIEAELDFSREAHNLEQMRSALSEFDSLVVPKPFPDYTTKKVLTMSYIPGRSVVSVGPLGQLEIPGSELADDLVHAYLHQVFVEGFVHADPHPGNVLVTDDNSKLAIIDLGMIVHVEPTLRHKLLSLTLAAVEGKSDRVAEVLVDLGEKGARFEEEDFSRAIGQLIARHVHAPGSEKRAGELLLEVVRESAANDLHLPSQLTLLGRTLLSLDWVGEKLDPTMDVDRVVERHAMNLMQSHTTKALSPANLLQAALDAGQLAQEMPGRLDRITASLADGKFRVEVDAVERDEWLQTLRGAANRLTLGLVVAALIIGSSLLVRVETGFTIFGYPGLATVFFLVGALSGVALMISIIRDRVH